MHQLVNVKILSALVLAGAVTAAAPMGAAGFFQSTTVDGEIGVDVGGIWLGLYHTAPTFRVRAELGEDQAESFDVGPVPKDLEPLLAEPGAGVLLRKIVAPQITGGANLFEGDVIVTVDGELVAGVEGFTKALAALDKDWALLQILRPSLRQTTANVIKLQYSARVEEVDGISAISDEIIRMNHVEGVLPFQDNLDKARQEQAFYTPSSEEVETLREQWHRLSPPARPVFVGAEHRLVAADEYDLALRKDGTLRGTQFAIVSSLKGNPTLGGGSTIAIYGVRAVTSDSIQGSYVQSSMAAAPFPISIDFTGAFRLIKLEEFSQKDAEHRNAMANREAGLDRDENWDEIELEPDVPASQ